jgi:hypothetical protein
MICAAGMAAIPAAASSVHRAPTSGHAHTKHHPTTTSTKTSHKLHGQQAIDSERVTQAAMVKYQADQGWQTKLMPDSRALIKLGLGPDHSAAINASEGSNFNQLNSPTGLSASATTGFASSAGVNH